MSIQFMASVDSLFVVSGNNFDPSLFSKRIGVSPTKVWRRTSEALKNRQDIPELEWQFQLDKRPHDSLDEAIREILSPFLAFRETIVNFIHEHNCAASVICRIHGDSTSIELCIEPATIDLLARLQCALYFSVDCDSAA
jgi:hypothetical protein